MIKQLKNLTEQEKSEFEARYKQMCDTGILSHPNKEFDNNGLRFDIDYLNKVKSTIIFLPVEVMADYVDRITKDAIDENDLEFIKLVVDSMDNSSYDDINTTSIGNIAYCYVYGKSDILKGLCYIWLNGLHKIEFDNMIKTMKEFYGMDIAIN